MNEIELKQELYSSWKTQEDLLQQYRSIGITYQAIIAAGVLVMMQTMDASIKEVHGLFYKVTVLDKFMSAFSLIKIIIFVVLIVMGCLATWRIGQITASRANAVTFFQRLLIRLESGVLAREFAELGVDAKPKIYTMFVYFNDKRTQFELRDRLSADKLPEAILRFVDNMRSDIAASDLKTHAISRRYFKSEIYWFFWIFWSLASVYCLFYCMNYFVPLQ